MPTPFACNRIPLIAGPLPRCRLPRRPVGSYVYENFDADTGEGYGYSSEAQPMHVVSHTHTLTQAKVETPLKLALFLSVPASPWPRPQVDWGHGYCEAQAVELTWTLPCGTVLNRYSWGALAGFIGLQANGFYDPLP